MTEKKFQKIYKLEIFASYEECEESSLSSYHSHYFLVILKSNLFLGFLNELEVHIVSMDDDKVEYGPK